MKQHNRRTYAFWIGLTLAVGGLSGFLTREGSRIFNESEVQPPLSPPAIVFPIVWGILYTLMGISAARIRLAEPSAQTHRGINLYLIQLVLNFFWSLIFFNLRAYGLAFFWLIALWITVLLMILAFSKSDRPAALLQLPYLLWLTFAAYLSLSVWYLNP